MTDPGVLGMSVEDFRARVQRQGFISDGISPDAATIAKFGLENLIEERRTQDTKYRNWMRARMPKNDRLGYALLRGMEFTNLSVELTYVLRGERQRRLHDDQTFLLLAGLLGDDCDQCVKIVEKPTAIHSRRLAFRVLSAVNDHLCHLRIQELDRTQGVLLTQIQFRPATEMRVLSILGSELIPARLMREIT